MSLLSGCDFDVYSLPLPGGTDVGDDPITVTVQFEDVLDLVPKSTVKVNDVSVGQVRTIELEGYDAKVTLELRNDTELPDNTVAEIRQTSLLGEKFVSLAAPESGAEGTLGDGEVIPLERTGRNPEVEEVLGALSLMLNGGGVAQLKTITQELNKAVTGREGNVRSVLTQIDTFTPSWTPTRARSSTRSRRSTGSRSPPTSRRATSTSRSRSSRARSPASTVSAGPGWMLEALDQLSTSGSG